MLKMKSPSKINLLKIVSGKYSYNKIIAMPKDENKNVQKIFKISSLECEKMGCGNE